MKWLKRAYVLLIAAVCTLPLLLSPLAGGSSAEKRDLAPFPAFIKDGAVNLEFFAGLDDWIADHFAGRSQLITANNTLKATLFGTSDEDKVIVGENGWLYFAETAPDYLGTDPLSEQDLSRIEVTLSLMDEYVRSQGGQFVFAVAPNKNTVYPENMPYYYRATEAESNLDRLTARLSDAAWYADLKTLVSDGEELLYHARDSHWNNLGARLAYAHFLSLCGKSAPDYADTPYTWETTWEGDLDGMIFPSAGILDQQAVFDVEWTHEYTSNFRSEEDILITTENPDASGHLLMFRDSFGNALLPFFAENYASATFSRAMPYKLTSLEETPCDTVIVELVERNIRNLLNAAPVMPAPVREAVNATPVETTVQTRETEGMLLVYGSLSSAAERVYLSVETPEGTMTVEAFPFAADSLVESENGFSAYLPAAYSGCEIRVLTN